MNLKLDIALGIKYSSNSQIARVLTESWVPKNVYCLSCRNTTLQNFTNNQPVADFFCSTCKEEYELKSKTGTLGLKVVDGAYDSMISRISSTTNPNFFFLSYNKNEKRVTNFIVIPKHFFTPSIIDKRKPLSITARRAGWVGCNINLTRIPELGKIFLIRDSIIQKEKTVFDKWNACLFLRAKSSESKGWTLEIMKCLENISTEFFSLADVYRFETYLKGKFPANNFVKDKIRQQLQILRDRGIIEFNGRGNYRKNRL